MLLTLVAAHVVLGLGVFSGGARLGRRSLVIAALAPRATAVWLFTTWSRVVHGGTVTSRTSWVPTLGINVALRLDALGLVMALAVAVVGVAVLVYSYGYFAADDDSVSRFAGLLLLFAGAMLGVVMADDLITLFTAWELTSITSYLLIGNNYRDVQARAAALHALLVTSLGGLVMLAGFVLIGQAAGTYRLSEILAHPPQGTTVTAGLVCVAIGAFTKSAQYPFHAWLPGAMAAPTPTSAYLHSATMVKAGVYLVARFAPVFAAVAPWRPMVITVGLLTMVFGALRALRQYDLKLLLAHGTVSQLGFMMVAFGSGTPAAVHAAIVMLIAHVLFKAALFMVVGIVDHQTGSRDIRVIPPLGRGWVPTAVVAAVSAASMAGVPLLAGFLGKEAAFAALAHHPFGYSGWVLAVLVAGSVLTVAYSGRFLWGLLVLPRRLRRGTERVIVPRPADERLDTAPPPRAEFLAPAAVLAALTLAIGVAPVVLDGLAAAAARSLAPGTDPAHLAVWHGWNTALLLSGVALALGAVLFAIRSVVARVTRVGRKIPSALDGYQRVLSALNTAATRVTGLVQNGSLPIYLGVVLVTAAGLPLWAILTQADLPRAPEFSEHWALIPVSMVLIGGGLAAAMVRRRFTAVLFLSTVGYGMAALFVLWGAPDLALTQAAVETVSTVLFVLVLRRLPDRFERRSTRFSLGLRVVVSVMVAGAVLVFALVANSARRAEPVSTEMIERALPDGKGRNVVNVILVDFRGFDTMGEISVLVAAAIGTVTIAHSGRRRGTQRGDRR